MLRDANKTVLALAAAVVVLAIVVIVLATAGGSSSSGEVPITSALLQQAVQQADHTQGAGYDDTCAVLGGPRQIVCQGAAGGSIAFLVSPSGQLQEEPGSTAGR